MGAERVPKNLVHAHKTNEYIAVIHCMTAVNVQFISEQIVLFQLCLNWEPVICLNNLSRLNVSR
jgi:hypothetical protein